MSARKLQGEIERTLKKINEGIIEFEGVLTKVRTASTTNQKDKHEADLKRDIKKLQRLREQVKAWISGNEVKNKAPLQDARKRIETQMETFKAYEREAKTKAYSKEGLQRQREKEIKGEEGRRDITDWLQDRIETLKLQIEVLESEIESSEGGKKKKSGPTEQTAPHRLERHNFHLDSLEKLLRMWENVAIDRDQVEGVKDAIDYYIDCNQEDDFMEDEGIYEELGLDDWDPEGLADHDYGDYDPADSDSHTSDFGEEDGHSDDDHSSLSQSSASETASSSRASSKAAPDTRQAETQYAGSHSDASSSHQTMTSSHQETPKRSTAGTAASNQKAAPILTVSGDSSAPVAMLDPTPAEAARAKIVPQVDAQPIHVNPAVGTTVGVPTSSTVTGPTPIAAPIGAPAQGATPAVATSASAQVVTAPAAVDVGVGSQNASSPPLVSSQSLQPPPAAMGFTSATVGIPRLAPPSQRTDAEVLEMAGLKASARYLPEAEPSRVPYKPRTPTSTPSSYPSAPAQNLLDDPTTFQKFPPDLLFFLFYFQQNTYQQYLAARELKRQSWRYHTKYLTWFQRHEDPKTITSDYEQGTYVYFDYETGWCQRKKSEFTFQYVFLEDNDLP